MAPVPPTAPRIVAPPGPPAFPRFAPPNLPFPGSGGQVQFWYDTWPVARDGTGASFQTEVHRLTWLPLTFSEHVYLDGVEQEQHETWDRYGQDLVIHGAMIRAAGQLLEVRYAYDGQKPIFDWQQIPDIVYTEPQGSFSPNAHWRITNFFEGGYTVADDPAAYSCCFSHAIAGDYNTLDFWTVVTRPCGTVDKLGGFDSYSPMLIGDRAELNGVSPTAPDEISIYATQGNLDWPFTNVRIFNTDAEGEWFGPTSTPVPDGNLEWEQTPGSNNALYTASFFDTPYLPHASVVSVRLILIAPHGAVTPTAGETVTMGIFAIPPASVQYVFDDDKSDPSPAEHPWTAPPNNEVRWADPARVAEVGLRLGTVSSTGSTPGSVDVPLSHVGMVNVDTTPSTGYDPSASPAEGTFTYPRAVFAFVADNHLENNPPDLVDHSGAPAPGGPGVPGGHYWRDRRSGFTYVLEWTIRPPRFAVVEAAP
jgi:hypothetical protein